MVGNPEIYNIFISLLWCVIISFSLSIFMFSKTIKEKIERKNVYFMWGAGFTFLTFCYIIDILIVSGMEYLKISREMVRITAHTFLLTGLLLITAYSFTEKYIFPFIFFISAIVLLNISGENFKFVSSIYRSISFILIAYNFNILRNKNFSLAISLLTLYFFLAGIHDLDYFILREVKWYFPYGFALYGIFLSIIFYGFFEMDKTSGKFILNNSDFYLGVFLGIFGLFLNNFSAIYFKENLPLANNLVILGIVISFLPFIIFLIRKKNE